MLSDQEQPVMVRRHPVHLMEYMHQFEPVLVLTQSYWRYHQGPGYEQL